MGQAPDIAPRYVSVVNEFPEDLYEAMRGFVRTHPHWDQYRLMQVAVAGFLFQQGSRERAVARHYLDGLFDRGGAATEPGPLGGVAAPQAARRPAEPLQQAPAAAVPASRRHPDSPSASSAPLHPRQAPPAAPAPTASLRPVAQPTPSRQGMPHGLRMAS